MIAKHRKDVSTSDSTMEDICAFQKMFCVFGIPQVGNLWKGTPFTPLIPVFHYEEAFLLVDPPLHPPQVHPPLHPPVHPPLHPPAPPLHQCTRHYTRHYIHHHRPTHHYTIKINFLGQGWLLVLYLYASVKWRVICILRTYFICILRTYFKFFVTWKWGNEGIVTVFEYFPEISEKIRLITELKGWFELISTRKNHRKQLQFPRY